MPINDNDPTMRGATIPSCEPFGQAALLLVESLLHGLCEKGLLSNGEAIEIAERAESVQFDRAEAADGAGAPMWRSHAMLSGIAASLRTHGDGEPPSPGLAP